MVALLVIGFILLALTFDVWVQHRAYALDALRRRISAPDPLTLPPELRPVPEGLALDPRHVWLESMGKHAVRVGVDAFYPATLGRPDVVRTLDLGAPVWRGAVIATLARGDREMGVHAPFDGHVVAVNPALAQTPGLVAEAPYTEGWLYRIEPLTSARPMLGARTGRTAREWLAREGQRLKELLVKVSLPSDPALGATALDGGVPVPGAYPELPEEAWRRLTEELLEPAPEPPRSWRGGA
ncbi:MAG: hypothetical protein H6730_11035 [Deltaproteobacteria bacterium]|nr:hypothetical protein [Deltaproteobacteria bacterium]